MAEEGLSEIILDLLVSELTLALSSTAVAPFERVKLLLQNQEELIKSGRLLRPYKGVKDCFSRTVKNEGFLALWRGNSATVFCFLPIQFHSFFFKHYFKKMLNVNKDEDGYLKRFLGNMVSYCVADASSLPLVYSLDYARTRLANDVKAGKKGGKRQFKGLIDVYKKTLKSDGFSGLYRGFGVSCVRIVVYRALFFGIFDLLKPMVEVSSTATFLLGWGMKIVAVLGTYPIDTVRRRMIMTSGEAFKYSGSIAAFKQVVANEGFKSLFKGASANVLMVLVQVGFLRRYGVKLGLLFSDLCWLLILPSHVLKKFRLM